MLKGDESGKETVDVLLVNTTGELMNYYGAADVAYVGKSLAGQTGGHNIIEPAIFGKAIIHGSHMENFRAVAELFRNAEASVEVVQKTVREKKKRSFKEEREYQQLTADIASLEAEKEQIHQEMASVTDYQKLQAMGSRLEEIKDLLDEKELRWLELDEWS